MESTNFFIVPQVTFVCYSLAFASTALNSTDGWRIFITSLAVIFSGILRIMTIRSMFWRKRVHLRPNEIFYSIISHILLFSSLFLLFKDDYSIPNPSNLSIDSLYYTTDILSSIGTSDIRPVTPLGKFIGIFHNIDTYLLLILIGYEIIFALRNTAENAANGSPEKA